MKLSIFLEQIPDEGIAWWQNLASGLGWTLGTAFFAWIIAFTLGSIVGVVRTTDKRWLVHIVQFFVWYFVVPNVIPAVKAWVIAADPTEFQFVTSIVCLGLFTSARIAEQVRSGIQSLSTGQRNAGYAIGLTQPQTYRYVLLPMAYRIIIPPLTSEVMNLIKNTSVAFSIGLVELFFRTREMAEMTFRYFETFAAATLIYMVIAFSANRVMAVIEKRVAVPGYITGGK
jgi:glutamate/aspartate transport system permease protein